MVGFFVEEKRKERNARVLLCAQNDTGGLEPAVVLLRDELPLGD
jgi:hypothetical protein